MNWALDNGADVANFSAAFYTDTPELNWLDRAFDYTARNRLATIIAAAGNKRDQYIATPAKGWNVITVGGIYDQDTTDWSDDVMYQTGVITGSLIRAVPTATVRSPRLSPLHKTSPPLA